MVGDVRTEHDISIDRCRDVAMLSKSVFRYKGKERNDGPLRMRIREIAATGVPYGFWRIYISLGREGFMDSHKRVYRVYIEEGPDLGSERPRRNRAAANRRPDDGSASGLHECRSTDSVSDRLFDGTRSRGLTVVDGYSGKCLSINAGRSLKGTDAVQVIECITFERRALPKRIKMDNGSEFIGKVWDECLKVNRFLSLDGAQEKFDAWREGYNGFRTLSSLGDIIPNEYIELNENTPDYLVMTSSE